VKAEQRTDQCALAAPFGTQKADGRPVSLAFSFFRMVRSPRRTFKAIQFYDGVHSPI